jgi:5-methylcytosine-specific restriction enzyme subunit McrC
MSNPIAYHFEEQQSLSKAKQQFADKWQDKDESWMMQLEFSKSQKISEVRNLGLSFFNNELSASYYIGIDWIKIKDCEQQDFTKHLIIYPKKNENLDYVRMFVHCLKHPEISKFLKDSYHCDFRKPLIKLETNDWELTPFIIVHFLALTEKITKQGLKKNYVVTEENLSSKIKGKIIFSQQLKKNIIAKREDRVYCCYQEYSVNCLENRLLKKALLFVQRYSVRHLTEYKELIQKANRLLSYFENISEEISYPEIKRIKVNALYKEYVETIDLAKKILQHFGYSYKKADSNTLDKELPPFWIDMSKLFELYVYSLLKEGYKDCHIEYQEGTRNQKTDFLFVSNEEQMILDTKYKPQYNAKYEMEDIRQLSGYARTKSILNKISMKDDGQVVDCVIIYPNNEKPDTFNGRELKEEKMSDFTKFYKCGIRLPVKCSISPPSTSKPL